MRVLLERKNYFNYLTTSEKEQAILFLFILYGLLCMS